MGHSFFYWNNCTYLSRNDCCAVHSRNSGRYRAFVGRCLLRSSSRRYDIGSIGPIERVLIDRLDILNAQDQGPLASGQALQSTSLITAITLGSTHSATALLFATHNILSRLKL